MISGCAASLIFAVTAYLAGSWADCPRRSGQDNGVSPVFRFSFGGCAVLLLCMCVCLAGGMFSLSTAAVSFVMTVTTAALCASGMIIRRRRGLRTTIARPGSIGAADVLLVAISLLLFVLEIYAASHFSYETVEPLRCVATATAVFDSARLHAADPMMLLIGTLSSVTGIHPLVFIYKITCIPLMLLYHMCCLAVINSVCRGRSRTIAFIVVQILCIRGYQSETLAAVTLMLTWYGIWTYVIHGLLSVAAVIIIGYVRSAPPHTTVSADQEEDDLEEWDMKKHRILNIRNLAVALAVLAAALICLVLFLNSKINKLYDFAVSLQKDVEDRCGLYEFSDPDGKTDGYLLVTGDGTLTFVGGGSADNAEALSDFLKEYGEHITNWYVYGDDEENAGAMRKLISSGEIDADNIYVLDRKEIDVKP